ncbi:MAG TPA: tetratricopeptide repeat protein [Verrucomicrobiae bacterium]
MKRYFVLAIAILVGSLVGAPAQGLDEQYVQIFNMIQEADGLSTSQPAKALAKYADAQTLLQRLQKGSPDWNPKVVAFRLAYVGAKIDSLSTNAPQPAVPVQGETNKAPAPAVTNAAVAPTPAALPAEVEAQLATLKDQVRQLQADRIVMEAKLKEALSVQPAEADPRELAKSEEKVKSLQKENELLKAAVDAEKSKTANTDPKALDAAQQALATANRQLVETKETAAKLTIERDALQNKLKTNPDAAALLAENQLLKQKLLATGATPAQTDDTAKRLSQAQTEIASLQSDRELLRLEKAALENRLKSAASNTVTSSVLPGPGADSPARVRQLERDRDDLQKKLDAANKTLYGRKGKAVASRVEQLELDLSNARARLEVFEARQVPYSPEELALLRTPDAKPVAASARATRTSSRQLPPGSTRLVTEAETWFAARQFDKAEAAYTGVVRMDPRNVPALANLAVVQIEAGHLDQAEKSILAALAEDPESPFSLRTLGLLRFRQAKYDDALDALSRAAKLDPDNPEIQNHLGLVLSEKGMRVPAETALRKAIQLQPNYGRAHYNLAIVYMNQQPPAIELARWHYKKAMVLGEAPNSEVETKLQIR